MSNCHNICFKEKRRPQRIFYQFQVCHSVALILAVSNSTPSAPSPDPSTFLERPVRKLTASFRFQSHLENVFQFNRVDFRRQMLPLEKCLLCSAAVGLQASGWCPPPLPALVCACEQGVKSNDCAREIQLPFFYLLSQESL